MTPLDVCLNLVRDAAVLIRHHIILQPYVGMLARRHGLLCIHAILRSAALVDGNEDVFELPVEKLNTVLRKCKPFWEVSLSRRGTGLAAFLGQYWRVAVAGRVRIEFPRVGDPYALLRPCPAALLLLDMV